MAKNPKECPYFIAMSRQKIKCKGIVEGCEIQQGYPTAGKEKEHYAECCYRAYHRCPTAQMLNMVWHEYGVHVCPYNSGVDCLHADECDRCGWNPGVADERLKRFLSGADG